MTVRRLLTTAGLICLLLLQLHAYPIKPAVMIRHVKSPTERILESRLSHHTALCASTSTAVPVPGDGTDTKDGLTAADRMAVAPKRAVKGKLIVAHNASVTSAPVVGKRLKGSLLAAAPAESSIRGDVTPGMAHLPEDAQKWLICHNEVPRVWGGRPGMGCEAGSESQKQCDAVYRRTFVSTDGISHM